MELKIFNFEPNTYTCESHLSSRYFKNILHSKVKNMSFSMR